MRLHYDTSLAMTKTMRGSINVITSVEGEMDKIRSILEVNDDVGTGEERD